MMNDRNRVKRWPRRAMSDGARGIRRPRRAWPPTARTAVAIAASTVIAACGSSSPSSSSSGGHRTQAQIQEQLHQDALSFARCMRSHRVSNFPDPTSPSADKEFLLGQIPGLNPQAPAFQSADTACKHLLPGGGSSAHGATAQAMAQLLHTSRCLRAHGLPGFPDPTTSPPSNQAAYLAIIGFSANHAPPGAPPVAYLAVPNSIDPNSPAAKQAATACHFRLQ
jgi:hypothetical protein